MASLIPQALAVGLSNRISPAKALRAFCVKVGPWAAFAAVLAHAGGLKAPALPRSSRRKSRPRPFLFFKERASPNVRRYYRHYLRACAFYSSLCFAACGIAEIAEIAEKVTPARLTAGSCGECFAPRLLIRACQSAAIRPGRTAARSENVLCTARQP